jgi:cell division transport system permease protein
MVAVATIAISLFAAGLARGVLRWIDGLIVSLDSGALMTVYLKDNAPPDIRNAVLAKIRERGGEAKIVTPEAALQSLAAELDRYGEVLQRLPKNPLPWTVEAHFSRHGDPTGLRNLAEELKGSSGVEDVDYAEKAIERLSALSKVLRIGGTAAFVIVLVITVIIVSATLQLAIYGRREEVEIQRLVGATNAFVKAPFLIEGVLQGLIGAFVASAALWGCARLASSHLSPLVAFLLGSRMPFRLLEPSTFLELIAAGAVLGLGGSVIAVTRFLRI